MMERGPRENLHMPRFTKGCYRGRLEDCCWLCAVRIAVRSTATPIRYSIRKERSVPEHDLVGEEVTVPYVDNQLKSLEQTTGTVVAVHTLSDEEPDILTVETDHGKSLRIEIGALTGMPIEG